MNTIVRQINFDMDGTLCDFYGVEGWSDDLDNYNTRPYEIAKPLLNLSVLARYLNKLQSKGYTVNIISWLSKTSTADFDERVTRVK